MTAAKLHTPLCVDLDGSLLRSDMLWESVLRLLRQRPVLLFSLPLWLARGKAALKMRVAEHVHIPAHLLPYNVEVLAFLRDEKQRGRKLVLATASPRRYAQDISSHLGVFDEIVCTDDEQTNMKSENKARVLSEKFGEKKFEYLGNSQDDIPVWRKSCGAYIVHSQAQFASHLEKEIPVHKRFLVSPPMVEYVRALRVHQWLKNILIFVPLLLAHASDVLTWKQGVLAFFAFSCTASAVYIINDLLDLDADRAHVRKKFRPFASGALPLSRAFLLLPMLAALAVLSALVLPSSFHLLLAIYCVITTLYSLFLKSLPIIDIVVLAGLYTIRIIAGGAAAQVYISPWLLGFSLFFFLSLACVKRVSELLVFFEKDNELKTGVSSRQNEVIPGRAYVLGDLSLISQIGVSSGLISVLVFALYIYSPDVHKLYTQEHVLWLLCPVLLYWVVRIWFLTHRACMHDDPVLFAIRDKVSYILGAICAAVLYVAM